MECIGKIVEIKITEITAIITLFVTIGISFFNARRTAHMRLVDNFNKLYNKTFELRKEINRDTLVELNTQFYYEIDVVEKYESIHNKILDYLTEMEDFFFLVVNHHSVKRTFEKLMSFALYERLLSFYGFILRQRKISNNPTLFSNYERALLMIRNMKKIKGMLPPECSKCYVGFRFSDCIYDNHYFQEKITVFADEVSLNDFPTRPNQNKANKMVLPYLEKNINSVIQKTNASARFMFYNSGMSYNLSPELKKYFICQNSRELLESINNKQEMKDWLSRCQIPVVSYKIFSGNELTFETIKMAFPGNEKYVIQYCFGGGGIGTYLITETNFENIKEAIKPQGKYIVSPYIEKCISVNTHVFISNKQTVLSPGSIQIIEPKNNQLCYRGADFIAFRSIPNENREKIKELSLKAANLLRDRGYRGIAGIDFIITNENEVYCMEINPRFQASSFILDTYLNEQKGIAGIASSVFELNEQAFYNVMMTPLCFEDVINYSCYYYYKEENSLSDLLSKRNVLLAEGVWIHDDGLSQYAEDALDENSYLFRALFPHEICTVSPDTCLWLNDNIPVEKAPENVMKLKIALLNQGVRVAAFDSNIKHGVYESIDIAFYQETYSKEWLMFNCGYHINLSQYSPYEIRNTNGKVQLFYYETPLGSVRIEKDNLASFSQIDRRILYLATDRLRIKMVSGCEYKSIGRGCKFCNLPMSKQRFSRTEIEQALLHLKESQLPFRHILIGGGTCLDPNVWEDIIWLCQYLKKDDYYKDKPISLMSILPPAEMLPLLKEAGLEEVAFNLEIVDEKLAQYLMPAKHSPSKTTYYQILQEAVTIFGIKNVRSALLVGLDKEADIIKEVNLLASMNVVPCLSAFRALPESEFSGKLQPDNATLYRVYNSCCKQLEENQGPIKELGPCCKSCRNNMLAI